jgi:hypothetical protein
LATIGNFWQQVESEVYMQRQFNFMVALKAPMNAADSLVSQINSTDQAIRVSLMQKRIKDSYYANQMNISVGYFSRIANGKRPMPEWMIEPFCALSGTNLLKQYIALQMAIHAAKGDLTKRQIDHQLAEQLRNAA